MMGSLLSYISRLAVAGAVFALVVAAQELAFTDITEKAGTGGPTEPGKLGGHGAAWADVDGDGKPDLYITMIFNDPMPDLFFHNKGGGRFANEGVSRGISDLDGGSHGVAFADLDNDGDYDLFNGATWDFDEYPSVNQIYRNDGQGYFSKPLAVSKLRWPTRGVLAFDMDRDGDLDLFAVTNYKGTDDPGGERNELYRNDGGMHFSPVAAGALVTAPCGQGVIGTDYDTDGDIDVLCANRTGPVNILRNDGKGFFAVPAEAAGIEHRAPDGISAADVDQDGSTDLLLAGDDAGYLYINRGNGRFYLRQEFLMTGGYMGAFGDLDNDGDQDLIFAGDSKVYLNDGEGNFLAGARVPVEGINDPRAVAMADFDEDGDVDFAIGCKRSRNWLVRNDWNAGNWVKVRLVSPQGQAGALGAKVKVTASGEEKKVIGTRAALNTYGYLAQDDPVLHFGLGEHFMADISVEFLTGEEVTVERVFAKQTVTIDGSRREASGAVQDEQEGTGPPAAP